MIELNYPNQVNSVKDILQRLIQFDTTNPPGNELECMNYINELLTHAGFSCEILSVSPDRPNLITRLKGNGTSPPFLFYGHADVVTTKPDLWCFPPFSGVIEDHCVWGRGALDMKGGLAMMIHALLRAKHEKLIPSGDIILAVLCDEEMGSRYGAKFLVENHPDRFKDIRYAIGEFGGFSFYSEGQLLYAIQVQEKQFCWLRGRIKGLGGHGSLPVRDGVISKLTQFLDKVNKQRFQAHITPAFQEMINGILPILSIPKRILCQQLLNPLFSDIILMLMGEQGKKFYPLIHHTMNVTLIQGGQSINVIPEEIVVDLDVRLLPGFTPDDMMKEFKSYIGPEIELEVVLFDPGPKTFNMELFPFLSRIIQSTDPKAHCIPILLPGVTDSRFFAQLGIQTYGFTPMKLPPGFEFSQYIHAINERIPLDALEFGANAIFECVKRYGNEGYC